jgi:hypothetical protein
MKQATDFLQRYQQASTIAEKEVIVETYKIFYAHLTSAEQ